MNRFEHAMRVFADVVSVPTAALILVASLNLPETWKWLAFAAAVLAATRGFIRVGQKYPDTEILHGLVAGNPRIDLVFDCVVAAFGAYAIFSILAVRGEEMLGLYWPLQIVAMIVPIALILLGLKRFSKTVRKAND